MSEKKFWTWLRSEQGALILVNHSVYYKKESDGNQFWAARDLTIVVVSQVDLSYVDAVIINNSNAPEVGPQQESYEMNLLRAGSGIYLATLNIELPIKGYTDIAQRWYPQIAVNLDGDWQRDPVQGGSHNFNFTWTVE